MSSQNIGLSSWDSGEIHKFIKLNSGGLAEVQKLVFLTRQRTYVISKRHDSSWQIFDDNNL